MGAVEDGDLSEQPSGHEQEPRGTYSHEPIDPALPRLDAEACGRADGALMRAFDLLGKRWTGVVLGR